MKRLSNKIVLILFMGILAISCGKAVDANHSDANQHNSIDKVIIYQDDVYDSIPKGKIVYHTAWGNSVDRLKPKFNIQFCKDNFQFPYYFPATEQLKGIPKQSKKIIINKHLQPALQTAYSMNYDNGGRISHFSITGPSTIYSCNFVYDKQNRIHQILDDTKRIVIFYTSLDNIESISEISASGRTTKSLKFEYTYVAFPRH